MEIPAGKWCDRCPFDHVWDMAPPQTEDYVCMAFPKEPHRKEDFRCPACLSAYPHGATVRIEAKEGK